MEHQKKRSVAPALYHGTNVRVIEGRHERRGPMERLLDLGPGPRRAPHHFSATAVELQVPLEVPGTWARAGVRSRARTGPRRSFARRGLDRITP